MNHLLADDSNEISSLILFHKAETKLNKRNQKPCGNSIWQMIRTEINTIKDHITWEWDKNTRSLHIQANQEVSLFPSSDYKAPMKRQESMTNTKRN